MGQSSSIDRLDPAVRDAIAAAIKRGATNDGIVEMLAGLGETVSRSAVGRYTQQYREIAARQRDLASIAKAFTSEFGGEEDQQGRLLIQILTSVATRAILPIAEEDNPDLDGKELHFLARAVKDLTSASKTDIDREAKIREEAGKRARTDAAAAAVTSAKAAGASEETVRKVRAAILGIEA